jgi:uncharacterized membrane protein HdeD (DUF308 family)
MGAVLIVPGLMLIGPIPVSRIWFNGFAIGNDLVVEGIAVASFAAAIQQLPSGRLWPKYSGARPRDDAII